MEKDQKKLKTTPLGQAVNTVMMEQFPNIVDVKFSADMEKKLDIIEAGKADWVQHHRATSTKSFAKSLEDAEKNMEGKRVKVPDEDIPTDEYLRKVRPPHGHQIRAGTASSWLAPASRSAATPTALVKDTGGICPECGGHMLVAQKREGAHLLRLQQLPQVQLYDLGRACA